MSVRSDPRQDLRSNHVHANERVPRQKPGRFGALLRRHRLRVGLTQDALAERAGLSARAIQDLERGVHRAPQRETVTLLAAALRLDGPEQTALEEMVVRRRQLPMPRAGGPAEPDASLPRAHDWLGSPSPLSRTDRFRLVGRVREQDLLRAALSSALAGTGQLVLIDGEAGVGKTTLAEATGREGIEKGADYLMGRCYDLSETPPYGPWTELLRSVPSVASLAGRPPGPAEPGESPQSAAMASGSRLATQMYQRLVAATARQPLVLLLDDLHWADPASLDLLRVIGRQLATRPVLLLVTYRGDELPRRHPLAHLLPILVREARALRLDLRPLEPDDVRAMVEDRYHLPQEDTTRLAAYLQRRGEGNPFYIGEVLRTLEDERLLRPNGAGWVLGELGRVRVPPLLTQVIEARLARRGEDVHGLLELAAVIGQEVPLNLWAAVAAVADDQVLAVVEEAVQARMVDATVDGTAVRFRHALVREALYEGLLPTGRRTWHRRVGEVLAARDPRLEPDPDVVAYHFQQAGDARAVQWLVRAGERAQRAGAWLTAALRFEAALALLPADAIHAAERGWLLLRLTVLRRFDSLRGCVTDLEEAERCGIAASDAALVAFAVYNRGMLRCMGGDVRRGLAELMAGVAALDALPATDRAQLRRLDNTGDPLDAQNGRGDLAIWLAETGRYAEATALGERMIRAGGDAGADQTSADSRADAYFSLGFAYAGLGRPEYARWAFARARAAFRSIDHWMMVLSALHWELTLVVVPYQADRRIEGQRLVAEMYQVIEHLRDIMPLAAPKAGYISLLILDGDWTSARQVALSIGARDDPNRLIVAGLLGPLSREQGESDLAWAQVRVAFPHGPDVRPGDVPDCVMRLQLLAARLALDAGELVTAREWLKAHDRWLDWSGNVPAQADALLSWATYHRAADDPDRAHLLATEALTRAADPRQPLALVAGHRLLGELDTVAGRLAEAEAHLHVALRLAEACAATYEQALTQLAQAELGHVGGDLSSTHGHLDDACATFARLGASPALARAKTLAARLTPAAPVPATPRIPRRKSVVPRMPS